MSNTGARLTEADAVVDRPHLLEIFAPDTDKWTALLALGVKPEQVATVGDGHNDLRMLSSALGPLPQMMAIRKPSHVRSVWSQVTVLVPSPKRLLICLRTHHYER